jgi:hypothetical protein
MIGNDISQQLSAPHFFCNHMFEEAIQQDSYRTLSLRMYRVIATDTRHFI